MRKSKAKFLALAALGLLSVSGLSSCSQDEDVSRQSTAKGDILSFSPLFGSAAGTRATATTSANYLTRVADFKVWGYFNGGTEYYLGSLGDGGVVITHTSGKSDWDYKTSTDMVYWPSQALNFYAVTPSSDSNISYGGQNLTYTVPTDQSKQADVMVAKANSQTKTSNSGKVSLTFQHQLSQVLFRGITKSDKLSVEVKSITIHNVRNSVTVPLGTTGTVSQGTAYSNYSVGLASAATVSSTSTAAKLTDDNGVLLLAPQTTTGWAANTTTSAADGTHQTYLEIECKITSKTSSGVSYLLGSSTAYGKTYVPLGATWDAGKRYVYTLQFGTGWDENHNPISTPITFAVSVSDWSDSASNVSL